MAFPRLSQQMPPTIEQDKAPLAFGQRAIPKLNEDLLSTDVKLRQQTLRSLCDMLHDHQLVTQVIKEGCVANLKYLLLDSDAVVREKTTEAFAILALSYIGSMACLKGDVIVPLSHIFEDDFTACRQNAHVVIKRLSKTPQGIMWRRYALYRVPFQFIALTYIFYSPTKPWYTASSHAVTANACTVACRQ